MNELRQFTNEEFGSIRTLTINNEPWFVGKDIAGKLGYHNGSRDINRHVDSEDRQNYRNGTSEINNRGMTIINESGLYALILGSKLESAKRFKHWVTSEVLPSIRQNGGYIDNQENLNDSELMAKALLVAQRTIENKSKQIEAMRYANSLLEEQIERDKPKVLFSDAVSVSNSTILIGDLAKLLKQNGVDIGQKRLFEWMRENGYLIKQKGASYNMPTQRSIEMGLFRIKETVITHSDGHTSISKTVKVLGKGQTYFINKFLGEKKEEEE